MNIVFVTTQAQTGSTVRGRILPLARELHAHYNHSSTILVLNKAEKSEAGVTVHSVGTEPFRRTSTGKERLSGAALALNMLSTACRTALALWQLRPERVVLVKPLPHNTFGVWLWRLFGHWQVPLILDVDDFELEATVLTSFVQRVALHVAEYSAVRMMTVAAVATPFLEDRYHQLSSTSSKKIQLVPTGIAAGLPRVSPVAAPVILYLGSLSVASGHRVDMLPAILKSIQTVVPDARLLVAGQGDDEGVLDNHPGLTVLGTFEEHTVLTLLQQARLIIDPIDSSITCRAKSSFRVAIATAVGLPVVSSAIGIRSSLVPPVFHDRFFAIPGDSQSYAEKASALLQQPLTPAEQEQLQAHAGSYTWPVLASLYQALLA